MAKFTYSKVKINTDSPKKWYVSYTIKFGTGKTEYRKEYGGNYALRLNEFEEYERIEKAKWLLKKVNESLALGNDPKLNLDLVGGEILSEVETSKGVTYDEAFELMVKYQNWETPSVTAELTAHNSKIFFNAQFRKFVESLGKENDVTKITQQEIADFIIEKNANKDWNITTATRKLGVMNYMFAALIDAKKIKTSPATGLKDIRRRLKKTPQKVRRNRYEIWTKYEVQEFIKVGSTNKKYILDYTIGLTCYRAFIRRSEMLRITLSMVDLPNQRFILSSDITKTANSYESVIPLYLKISDDLFEALKIYIDHRFGDDLNPDYYLFSSIRKKDVPYDYYQYDKDYKERLGKALSNEKLNYSLKHTGVSEYWRDESEKGVSPSVILSRLKKMCRHKNILETMRYLSDDLGIDVDID